jgi:hypothetical protein
MRFDMPLYPHYFILQIKIWGFGATVSNILPASLGENCADGQDRRFGSTIGRIRRKK